MVLPSFISRIAFLWVWDYNKGKHSIMKENVYEYYGKNYGGCGVYSQ